eukprot:7288789-Pyramimonas_sp.AAC.1
MLIRGVEVPGIVVARIRILRRLSSYGSFPAGGLVAASLMRLPFLTTYQATPTESEDLNSRRFAYPHQQTARARASQDVPC